MWRPNGGNGHFIFLFLPPLVRGLEGPKAPTTAGLPVTTVSRIPLPLPRDLAQNATRTSPAWGAS